MGIQLPKPLGLEDLVPLRKHKDKSVAVVLDTDPSYLVWMHESTLLKIEEEIYNEAQELKAQGEVDANAEEDARARH